MTTRARLKVGPGVEAAASLYRPARTAGETSGSDQLPALAWPRERTIAFPS
jgi:hypothetical protein